MAVSKNKTRQIVGLQIAWEIFLEKHGPWAILINTHVIFLPHYQDEYTVVLIKWHIIMTISIGIAMYAVSYHWAEVWGACSVFHVRAWTLDLWSLEYAERVLRLVMWSWGWSDRQRRLYKWFNSLQSHIKMKSWLKGGGGHLYNCESCRVTSAQTQPITCKILC